MLFDDSPEELDSLEKLGAGRNIKTLLFHCRAHKAIEHPHWNIWGALKQLDNLVNQGTWISDAKAAGAE